MGGSGGSRPEGSGARRGPGSGRGGAGAALLVLTVVLAACGPKPAAYDSSPVDTSSAPEQTSLDHPLAFELRAGGHEFTVTPRATYVLRGVVLHRERYSYGWTASVAPCDVAMAWGELLKDGLFKKLRWSQSNRWYWWEYGPDWTLGNGFVVAHSSNTHIVPATPNVRRAVLSLRKGEAAELSGELVNLDCTESGWEAHWHTSLSRTDEGDGSCEILFLRRLRARGKVYE
jgi:hypothetical protein